MPKKGPRGENSKAVEARARKEDKKNEEKEKKEKAEEDAAWRDDDKMVLKKQSRMQQREASAAEKAAHKASLKAAYDEDMAAAASVTTSVKNAPAKLTRAEMQRRLDEEARREAEARGGAAATPATTHLDEPLVENLNRLQVEESARSVGEAIHVLAGKPAKEDKHPEKRLQAAYKAFEERMMPTVKEENKNMRLSQWKQIIWKEWTKSPENPINQAKLQRQNEELS